MKAAAAGGLALRQAVTSAQSSGEAQASEKKSGTKAPVESEQVDGKFALVGAIPQNTERTWIAPQYWGNRLQDWRISEGRIECVLKVKERYLNTVSLLTREMVPGAAAASLKVMTGRTNRKGAGFSGFLLGGGSGKLDWRAAALVQRGSGIGGGLLCVYNPQQGIEFREHTDEKDFIAWAPLKWEKLPAQAEARPGEVELRLEVIPQPAEGRFDLKLAASQDGKIVSAGIMRGVRDEDIAGGMMLVSAALSAPDTASFWFRDVGTSGPKIAIHEERALGPIVGALYTVNGNVMKMSAQLMPIGKSDPQEVALKCRAPGSDNWQRCATARIGAGFNAIFRVADWDSTNDWEYRVVYPAGDNPAEAAIYEGVVRKDPGDAANLKIGLYSCTISTNRLLDRGRGPRMPSWARFLGRYTEECICFPFNNLVKNGSWHKPDILFFVGDQFYEDNPSARDPDPAPTLDYLYKWLLWVWGFREMTRTTPTIVLTDDHDTFQPNLFGNGGREAPEGKYNHGGYRPTAAWVNMMQHTQCGHNPDPYDPTPVKQGITVYYCAFKYGGVDFAALEDRKWKTAPWQGQSLDVHEGVLLGDRQEKFLEEWGRKVRAGNGPRIVASQTIFACVQTSAAGKALIDFDCNGYPPLAKRKAMELIRDSGALIISGDQHLATVIRNGIDDYQDGPVQFTGPAGAATWTRWFQPVSPLENAHDTPFTGDFIDAFGNKCHVLAVANPDKLTLAEYWSDVRPPTQYIGDRNLKAEGYCTIDVDKTRQVYVLDCWRWDVDPSQPEAKPYPGWPVEVSFAEAGSASKS